MKRVLAVMVLMGFLVLSVVFYSRTYSRVSAAISNISGTQTKLKVALYSSESSTNKKKEDLAKRIEIITETNPDFVLCIHQNIFTDAKYSGAQVFYYQESEESARLAACLQAQLIAGVDPDNTRVPKSNMNYYMLKNSPVPIVIVECGFLTNAEEEAKLGTEEYQRKLAWNIYLGTMQYLAEE